MTESTKRKLTKYSFKIVKFVSGDLIIIKNLKTGYWQQSELLV